MGTPHNSASKGDIAKTVLMPGDPLRAKFIAEHFLEDAVCFNRVRNMFGYTGTYKGKEVSVMGSGMGMPSMGIYSYELFSEYDVDRIIRIGSAGGYADDVHVRDVIIAMAASTDSNYASQYRLGGTFAPTADYGMLSAAVEAAQQKNIPVKVGNVLVGGGAQVSVQSMLNIPSTDIEGSVRQAKELEEAGCEIIRAAIPNKDAVKLIPALKEAVSVPIVADIHFDYKLALEACAAGIDKIRINPGNIGSVDRVKAVVDKAKAYHVPIRVGVNSGSLEKDLIAKYGGHVTAEGIVESALDKVHLIEDLGYDQMVISIKSSDVMMCVKAHELIAAKTDYPLHVGITESGTLISGNIKSAVGLGIMLNEGVGHTIRVSLTGDPLEEIKSAKLILKTLGLRKGGIEVVSCPTCGRTRIDLIGLANKVENLVQNYDLDIKVAVMGCVVNGPGEAREADIGVAGGIGEGLLIKKGEIVKKVPEDQLLAVLKDELDHWNK